ncbi:MAG: FAD-binding protein [Chloroflexi bacterium]|nr:FAD-binding protein [Chloroflexota bacterium]
MADVIIVGSGAAGTAAALALAERGIRPLLLDVGYTDAGRTPRVVGNLYDYRKRHDSFDLQIGADFRGVSDVLEDKTGVAKLNAPNTAFVTEGAERLGPVLADDFDPIQSFAKGGLANAWGAGLYRFTSADLAGFPIRPADLTPHFNRLTEEIGISGADDDLTPYFGDPAGLLPALALSHNADRVYRSYRRQRAAFGRLGIAIGRPRVGVLAVAKDGRPACDYSNTEFWQDSSYLYTPIITLDRLIAADRVEYWPGVLVRSWVEQTDGVTVVATDVRTGEPLRFAGQKLLLAAGAINTTRIVLQSRRDYTARLPLLENSAVQIPFVLPASLGRRLDTAAFGLTQLNLIWESPVHGILQGSILELTSPMRAEFFGRFPLSARANLQLIRTMLPAMLLMQLFFPAAVQRPAAVSLLEDGRLRIQGHPNPVAIGSLGALLRRLRSVGLWTHPMLIYKPVTGHAIHYAGTLPLRETPGRYECDPSGKLSETQRVYIVDSACFSTLPAKNMSFGMMANAMRVATNATQGM